MSSTDFLSWFRDLNSHMFLIKNSSTNYCLFPPNQSDWKYNITELENNIWNVKGVKVDIYSMDMDNEIDHIYKYIDNEWTISSY
jgi:hypothetical protein